MNLRHIIRTVQGLLLAMLASMAMDTVMAAPGVLANEPLQTSASAPPNILFHLDTSGSMQHIVPEYDSSSYSFTCDNADAIISEGESWSWAIVSGVPKIQQTVSGTLKSFSLGNNAFTRCFDPAGTFETTLDLSTSSATGGDTLYTGAYLNWYFNTATDGTGNWTDDDHKPGARSRMEVAQSSLKALISTLSNVHVGLTTFDSGSGANLVQVVQDLEVTDGSGNTHLDNLITSINGTSAGGSTPLAESARDIGRYFSNNGSGQCGGGENLTIHPGHDTLEDTVACDLVLGNRITQAGPIQYFCQKNFAVMLTDGQPSQDRDIPTYLEDYDQDCTADAQSDGSYSCDTYDGKDTVTYTETTWSDYWDDVTQALYEIDLRPDLDDFDNNPVKNNLATYTIGFASPALESFPLIKEAAEQAGGEFLFAGDPNALIQAFEKATSSIIAQSSTSSAVTFNSSTLSSQSAVYQALFNTVRWSGELRSIPLDGFTGAVLVDCTPGTDNCWAASEQLDNQDPNNRVILTYHTTEKAGRAFRAPGDYESLATSEVPQPLIDDLCASSDIPYTCTTAVAAEIAENQAYLEELVAYLRGDRSNEGAGHNFRTRTNVLGDIVNSSPVYVSKPAANWPNKPPFPPKPDSDLDTDNSYGTWASSSIKDRTAVVYAAANDGLLHGFRTTESATDAGDAGNEVLAYVPTGTFSSDNLAGLHYLADPDYQHRFYNDLTPTVSDVYITHRTSSGTSASEEWRTVLIGGLRGGGRMLYMLDITDPSAFSESNANQLVEWEFTHNDLGYAFSKPTIAMMNNGRFAAIFGNGYKSGEDGGAGDCRAKLFVVFLDGGQDGVWTLNTDYYVFDTGVGTTADCNGLSTPAVVDLNKDKVADRVYAGDLHGNLWAFDLCDYDATAGVEACSPTPGSWGATNLIMTANDGVAGGTRQPITVKPVVSRDPASTGGDDLLITFGTGQYLTEADKSDTSVQTMYGVREYGALTNSGNYGLDPRQNSSKFIDQTITEITDCSTVVTDCTGVLREITNDSIASNHNGWLIDLPTSGERVVVNPAIRNNVLFFNTLIPDSEVCTAGGSGWLMSVNLENGGVPLKPIFDINNDGVIDAADSVDGVPPVGEKVKSIPAESTFLGDKQYTPDSEGNINVRDVNIGKVRKEGRMSWRELIRN